MSDWVAQTEHHRASGGDVAQHRFVPVKNCRISPTETVWFRGRPGGAAACLADMKKMDDLPAAHVPGQAPQLFAPVPQRKGSYTGRHQTGRAERGGQRQLRPVCGRSDRTAAEGSWDVLGNCSIVPSRSQRPSSITKLILDNLM
jgi:hypothetical protein